ncbi:hypothetical protein F4808DRAFT_392549 [Astrocystis sublimbata]|nr:hypothetical protein F4808DRAFT_392549 [Astrocystis sublimbata]
MPIFSLPYKGSSPDRQKFNYPSPTGAGGTHPVGPTDQTYQLPSPRSSSTAQQRKQRRISRTQHGLRVSRRLPARTSRGFIPAVDNEPPLTQTTRSLEPPYWGTLLSPSKENRAIAHRATDLPSKEPLAGVPPKDKLHPEPTGTRSSPDTADARRQGNKTPQKIKRFGVADPLAWDIINRSLTQQRRLSSLVDPSSPVFPRNESSGSSKKPIRIASRTSSQRRALNQFTRELEKYADVAGAAGKAPVVTPTISDTKVSIHTVKPLVPYKDEFRAAGLAVTSVDQIHKLTGRSHTHGSRTGNLPRKPLHKPNRVTGNPDVASESAPSPTSIPPSCTSFETYVDFSQPGTLQTIESLVPPNRTKSRLCRHARKHFMPWLLKKPSARVTRGTARPPSVPTRIVKQGHIKSNGLSSSQDERRQVQHRSRRPTMQSIPETQLLSKPAPPAKFVIQKKEPYVALSSEYCEQSDRGPHPDQEGGYHGIVPNFKQPLQEGGFQGRKDTTRGVSPKSYPDVEGRDKRITNTEANHDPGQYDHNRYPSQINRKAVPGAGQNTRQQTHAAPSRTRESSVLSLPFAARLAAGTVTSLQRALDDACRKLDDEDIRTNNLSKHRNLNQDLPPIPPQDVEHAVPSRAPPHEPRTAEKSKVGKRTSAHMKGSQPYSKPLPPKPVSVTPTKPESSYGPRSARPTREAAPVPPDAPVPAVPRALTGKRKNVVAELSKAEEMLKDLDVFLNDHDDANIEDRDVIKGLQVAVHAAADDLYDGYIRHKTGLRIRRFLADLKSFEEMSGDLDPRDQGDADQRDRGERENVAKGKRREVLRDRHNRRA